MAHRIKERPSLRDRKRKDATPEKLLQILMKIYPEEHALAIFEKVMKSNDDTVRLERKKE